MRCPITTSEMYGLFEETFDEILLRKNLKYRNLAGYTINLPCGRPVGCQADDDVDLNRRVVVLSLCFTCKASITQSLIEV